MRRTVVGSWKVSSMYYSLFVRPWPPVFLSLFPSRRARGGDRAAHVRIGLDVLQFVVVEDPEAAAAESFGHREGHLGLGLDQLGTVLLDLGKVLLLLRHGHCPLAFGGGPGNA